MIIPQQAAEEGPIVIDSIESLELALESALEDAMGDAEAARVTVDSIISVEPIAPPKRCGANGTTALTTVGGGFGFSFGKGGVAAAPRPEDVCAKTNPEVAEKASQAAAKCANDIDNHDNEATLAAIQAAIEAATSEVAMSTNDYTTQTKDLVK